jgi:hypothetical protein
VQERAVLSPPHPIIPQRKTFENCPQKMAERIQRLVSERSVRGSDLLPPHEQTHKIFESLHGQPQLFGRLNQVRTMHGYNQAYYTRFNVDRDFTCACGLLYDLVNPCQVREHIFKNCEAYTYPQYLTRSSRE